MYAGIIIMILPSILFPLVHQSSIVPLDPLLIETPESSSTRVFVCYSSQKSESIWYRFSKFEIQYPLINAPEAPFTHPNCDKEPFQSHMFRSLHSPAAG